MGPQTAMHLRNRRYANVELSGMVVLCQTSPGFLVTTVQGQSKNWHHTIMSRLHYAALLASPKA